MLWLLVMAWTLSAGRIRQAQRWNADSHCGERKILFPFWTARREAVMCEPTWGWVSKLVSFRPTIPT